MNTRSGMRKNKQKRHYILNTLIGIVFILVLVIGGNMLFGGSDTAENDQGSTPDENGSNGESEDIEISENDNTDQDSNSTNQQNESDNSDQGSNSGQESNSEQNDNDDENNSDDESDNQEENDAQQENENESGVNSDQIGEPIGTSQTGEHKSSYKEGSVDWNEKVKAIQMATGVSDGMTLWRLESGGGPQQSVGKVSPEGVRDWMYVVDLQWVDQQGWKVTNVNKQSR